MISKHYNQNSITDMHFYSFQLFNEYTENFAALKPIFSVLITTEIYYFSIDPHTSCRAQVDSQTGFFYSTLIHKRADVYVVQLIKHNLCSSVTKNIPFHRGI